MADVSQVWLDKTLVFLDLETTGLVPDRDRIIEVGAVKVKGPLVQGTFTALVSPGIPIPFYITKLTGITDREILEKGQPLNDVLPALKEFVQDCPMVGHNLDFDLAFLKAGGLEFKNNPRLDTGLFTALISPAEKSYSLSALIKNSFQETESHRSLSDARHTFKLFRGLLDRLMEIDDSLLKGWISLLQEEEPLLSGIFQAVLETRGEVLVPQDKKDSFTAPDSGLRQDVPGREIRKRIPPKSLKKRISAILAEGGILNRLSGYEYRPQQLEMAQMVEHVLSEGKFLVVEAPTGVGKSLSYLVPAVLFADATGKKVVISTNTKNLQAQIWEKEIPFLRENLIGLKWQASRLLGRENYFCRRRFQKIFDAPRTLLPHDRVILAYLLSFCHRSEEGILAESAHFLAYRFPALRGYLEDLRATSEECLLKLCPFYHRCFYQVALKNAETSDVIISNHALTLSPPAGFPEFGYLVLDEAHNIEDAATETYSHIIENAAINRMLSMVRIKEKSQEIKDLWFRSSNHLLALLPETGTKSLDDLKKDKRWPVINLDFENFLLAWREVENLLRKPKEEGGGEAVLRLAKKFQDVRDTFGLILNPPDNYVSFAGREGTGRGNWFLKTSPVDVALMLRTQLFDKLKSAVLTSATLTVAGRFNFFLRRWGLADVPNLSTAVLNSPFDFSTQTVLGVPRNFHCYNYEEGEENFVAALSEGIKKSALILRGKELVLFFSRSRMEAVYRRIKEEMEKKGITVSCQNIDGSRRSLVERLKESTDDCLLFGTKSFQEGVDISGLTAVIIEKIPFPSQSDPLIFARQKAVEKEGGQRFRDYILPLAIISLRQSFGRLIRRKTDRGVVIIFDPRLVESYSEVFDSFPNVPRIIEDIPVFYEKLSEVKSRFT
ncbi:MAG: helicase C-terminal domain-containing protein [Candidatus Omnitrophota bacterium]